jgi:regulator of sigma D
MRKLNKREIEALAQSIFDDINASIEKHNEMVVKRTRKPREKMVDAIFNELASLTDDTLKYLNFKISRNRTTDFDSFLDKEKIESTLIEESKSLGWQDREKIENSIVLTQIESKSLKELTDLVMKNTKNFLP